LEFGIWGLDIIFQSKPEKVGLGQGFTKMIRGDKPIIGKPIL